MFGADFDVAIARLMFIQAYVKLIKQEVDMKTKHLNPHEKFAPREKREAKAPFAEHRRFWHRRIPAPAKPQSEPKLDERANRQPLEADVAG